MQDEDPAVGSMEFLSIFVRCRLSTLALLLNRFHRIPCVESAILNLKY